MERQNRRIGVYYGVIKECIKVKVKDIQPKEGYGQRLEDNTLYWVVVVKQSKAGKVFQLMR